MTQPYTVAFDPVAFHVGPLQIHWYGLMYLCGFLGAWLLADSESNAAPPIAALGAARAVRCGSNPVCEVCLHGRGVAAQHAEITLRSDGVVWLGLLEGREATWVNGVPVAGQTALNSGDVLQLGAVRLALVIAS